MYVLFGSGTDVDVPVHFSHIPDGNWHKPVLISRANTEGLWKVSLGTANQNAKNLRPDTCSTSKSHRIRIGK